MKQHLHTIGDHKVTRHTKRILKFKIYLALFLLLPVVVLTFLTSRTELIPGFQSFTVLTGSMEPTIPTGSVVYTQQSTQYEIGDIITFKNASDQTVTHRIAEIKDGAYITKGDANNTTDATSVQRQDVIGKVSFSIPHIGKIITYLQTPKGFILAIIAPTIFFVFLELWKIKKEIEKMTEERVLKRLQKAQTP
jgi:signal peptidase I